MISKFYSKEELQKNKFFLINLLTDYAKKEIELNLGLDTKDLPDFAKSEYVHYIEKSVEDYEDGKIEFELESDD